MFKENFVKEYVGAKIAEDGSRKFTVEGHKISICGSQMNVDDKELFLPATITIADTLADIAVNFIKTEKEKKKKQPMLLVDYLSKVQLNGDVFKEFQENFPKTHEETVTTFSFKGVQFTRILEKDGNGDNDMYVLTISPPSEPFEEYPHKTISQRCTLKAMIALMFDLLKEKKTSERAKRLSIYGENLCEWFLEYFDKNYRELGGRKVNQLTRELVALKKEGHNLNDIPKRYASYSGIETSVWFDKDFSTMMLACYEYITVNNIETRTPTEQKKALIRVLDGEKPAKKQKKHTPKKSNKTWTTLGNGLVTLDDVFAELNL